MTQQDDAWQALRKFTAARIALGRTGSALPTQANLRFQLDHARARDAVHQSMDVATLSTAFAAMNPLTLQSEATDRAQYLQRPDLGRILPEAQWQALQQYRGDQAFDVVLVVADGLSAKAANDHAVAMVSRLIPGLKNLRLQLAPLCLAQQARVALGDDIGEALAARLVLVLIGERPGLSSPDSLGIYMTHTPRRGCVDAQRNCISNIRPGGLSYDQALDTCLHLVAAAFHKGLSGVTLKDDSNTLNGHCQTDIPFLTPYSE